MLSKKTIALIAVTLLALPAIGAAAPIVQPPVAERLVEGHTVFTVITQVNPGTTSNTSRFAAAAAVLVREYNQYNAHATRFPGVLWFNDQYLVEPTYDDSRAPPSYRYPCGGAVIAVNQGDPDPRVSLARSSLASAIDGNDAARGQAPTDVVDSAIETQTGSGGQAGPDAPSGIVDTSAAGIGTADVSSFAYVESYLVTDPNDHSWVIDLYTHTHGAVGGPTTTTKAWVVNTLGHPGFLVDDGMTSCDPFSDLTIIPRVNVPFVGWTPTGADMSAYAGCYNCGSNAERAGETTEAAASRNNACEAQNLTGVTPDGNALGSFRDEPCRGAKEPSANGYCYDGNAHATGTSCTDKSVYPVRAYNALLYFRLEHLTRNQGNVDHSPGNTDTNGCQVGTEWACRAGDDNQEGNSHPFNPQWAQNTNTPTDRANPLTAQKCPYGGANAQVPNNHGGSGRGYTGGDANTCDDLHATFGVDVYFSATGRPLEPASRSFALTDVEGSEAPFQGVGTDARGDSTIESSTTGQN